MDAVSNQHRRGLKPTAARPIAEGKKTAETNMNIGAYRHLSGYGGMIVLVVVGLLTPVFE